MSKVSKKSALGAPKPSKNDSLSKVKGAAVAKPAQSAKAKSKEVAKEVAAKSLKKEKKSKVPVKEPTPEPESESESDDSDESSEEEESESEPEVKTNGAKLPAKDESGDESSSDESASEDDEPAKVNGTKAVAAESEDDSSEEDSEDDSSDDEAETKPAVNGAAKIEADSDDDSSDESESDDEDVPAVKTQAVKEQEDSDEDSEEDSDDSADSEAEEEEETEVKPAKRKAEEVEEPVAKKSKVDGEEKDASPNLFVGNLSWNVDEEWLKSEFESFGEIAGVRLITNRDDGRSKGYGYVEFVNTEDAMKAYAAKKDTDLDGRTMNIDYANKKKDPRERQETRGERFGDQRSEPSDTIFLGNLSFEASEEDVHNLFAPFGTATSVRIPTNPENGQVKGFGYVTFGSIDEAKAALEGAQGSYLNNRPLRLDFAGARPNNNGGSPSRGGFGGRGGGRGFGGGFGGRGGRGGGRGDFGGRGGRGGGRGRGAPRGGRGSSTNRGGFGDFSGTKVTF